MKDFTIGENPGFRVVAIRDDFAVDTFSRRVRDEKGEPAYLLEFCKGRIYVIHDKRELDAISPRRAPGVFTEAKFDSDAIKAFVAAMVPRT